MWNFLQTKGSEICREQRQLATHQPNQYYGQKEQIIDDNDDDDVFDLNDDDLFELEWTVGVGTTN